MEKSRYEDDTQLLLDELGPESLETLREAALTSIMPEMAATLRGEALGALEPLGPRAERLAEIAWLVVDRHS